MGEGQGNVVDQAQLYDKMNELRVSLEAHMDTQHGQVMNILRGIQDTQVGAAKEQAVSAERQRRFEQDIDGLGGKVKEAIGKRELLEDTVETHTVDIKHLMVWKDDQKTISAGNLSVRVAVISSVVGPIMLAFVAWLLSQIGIYLIPMAN